MEAQLFAQEPWPCPASRFRRGWRLRLMDGGWACAQPQRARAGFLQTGTGVSVHRPTSAPSADILGGARLVLGTDCSGADAPVWAMRNLWPGLSIEHAFACDSWSVAEEVIKANTPCRTFFSDILRRPPRRSHITTSMCVASRASRSLPCTMGHS